MNARAASLPAKTWYPPPGPYVLAPPPSLTSYTSPSSARWTGKREGSEPSCRASSEREKVF